MIKEKNEAVRILQAFMEGRQEIVLSYLFGSYLRKPRGFRDIDIAVYVDPGSLSALDREMSYGYSAFLNTELAGLLGYRMVDLVILNSAPPLLTREIIRSGELFFCRSDEERIRFEVQALKRFADTEHIRKIKRMYIRERIQEGLGAYETRDH